MRHSPSSPIPLIAELERSLRTRRLGRTVRYVASTGSTNSEALAWASQGAPEGAVVIADHQTAGRGRHGRPWHADAARNILVSTVLRPVLPAARWGLITIAASLAVCEIVDPFIAPLQTTIKWPNDILIEDRKCCGMLMETVTNGGGGKVVVLGIGLNVNQDSFPADPGDRATSIVLESGRHASRIEVLARLLAALERNYDAIQAGHATPFIEMYEARMALKDQTGRLRFPGNQDFVEGIIRGVSEDGALRLETPDGERRFYAGEVTLRQTPSPA